MFVGGPNNAAGNGAVGTGGAGAALLGGQVAEQEEMEAAASSSSLCLSIKLHFVPFEKSRMGKGEMKSKEGRILSFYCFSRGVFGNRRIRRIVLLWFRIYRSSQVSGRDQVSL